MYLHFPELSVQLEGDDPASNDSISRAFGPWLAREPRAGNDPAPIIRLQLSRVRQLARPPDGPPLYLDQRDSSTNLAVFQVGPDQLQLYFPGEALVTVYLLAGANSARAAVIGELTEEALAATGRLEDVLYTGLAPLLRRHGLFLLHAFAAARSGQALLFSGPSGSGKTTSGLAMLLDGWDYLANDVLLLQNRPEGVCAFATPGHIHARRNAQSLLPGLSPMLLEESQATLSGPKQLALLFSKTGSSGGGSSPAFAPVSTICFPQIDDVSTTRFERMNRAECLARLMAESVDHWDRQMLPTHIELLHHLCQQAIPYRLFLGKDVAQLPQLLPVGRSWSLPGSYSG